MNTENRLLSLINAYSQDVEKAVDLLASGLNVDRNNLMYWRSEGIARTGVLGNSTIRYAFHGIGCELHIDKKKIDFDFGYEGRINGFDVWRLWLFACAQNNDFPEFKDKEFLSDRFSDLEEQGVVKQLYKQKQDQLYYLTE